MMKTIDDLDSVQYNVLWNYLEDLDEIKRISVHSNISEWSDNCVKLEDIGNQIKALVMKHHLYDHDWNLAILNLNYIFCKRAGKGHCTAIEC